MVGPGFNKYGMPQGMGQPTITRDTPPNNPALVDHMDDNPNQVQQRTPTPLSQAIVPQNRSQGGRPPAEPGGVVGPAAHLPSIPMGVSTQDVLNGAWNSPNVVNYTPTGNTQQDLTNASLIARHTLPTAQQQQYWSTQQAADNGAHDANYWYDRELGKGAGGSDVSPFGPYSPAAGYQPAPPAASGSGMPPALLMALGNLGGNVVPRWQQSLNAIQQQQQKTAAPNPLMTAISGY